MRLKRLDEKLSILNSDGNYLGSAVKLCIP